MGKRKDYPFSRRVHKQGLVFLTKSIIGLLGAGAYAADGIKKAVEDNATTEVKPVKIVFWHYALFMMLFIPITFLSMKIPFIGSIVFIVLFSIFLYCG